MLQALSAPAIICLAIIFFLGYFEQQITGFGATLFCLPFALMLIPKEVFTFIAWAYTFGQSCFILIRQRKSVDKKQLLIVLILAGALGTPLSTYCLEHLPAAYIKWGLAAFIAGFSVLELYRSKNGQKNGQLHPWHYLFPVGSGALQASFGIGGPLLVAYLAHIIEDKNSLRSTLAGYWVFLNGFLLVRQLCTTGVASETVRLGVIILPAVLLGTLCGSAVLNKINQQSFLILVYVILFISSILILF